MNRHEPLLACKLSWNEEEMWFGGKARYEVSQIHCLLLVECAVQLLATNKEVHIYRHIISLDRAHGRYGC